MGYRPGVELPAVGFQGEGLLAVSPAPGEPTHVFAAPGPDAVPVIEVGVAHRMREVAVADAATGGDGLGFGNSVTRCS